MDAQETTVNISVTLEGDDISFSLKQIEWIHEKLRAANGEEAMAIYKRLHNDVLPEMRKQFIPKTLKDDIEEFRDSINGTDGSSVVVDELDKILERHKDA